MGKTCVICDNILSDMKYSPFCSKRCADVDLHRWSSETYTIPVQDIEYEDSIPEGEV